MGETRMIIEISPKKIIPEAITIWHEAGDQADILMDPKSLTFKPGSVDEIYAFHVLDKLFADEAAIAMKNWFSLLKPGGKLFCIVNDFEYITRAFVGGDINVGEFNNSFSNPSYYDRDSLINMFSSSGFNDADVSIWFDGLGAVYQRQHYELILSGIKK